MKIALVGYGKMGHMLEMCAKRDGHDVVVRIDSFAEDADVVVKDGNTQMIARAVKSSGAEGIIEFTNPSCVVENIKALLPLGLPLVVGTTGWNDKKVEITEMAKNCAGIIMTSSNFSIGVNLFYKIVAEAAKIMSEYSEYDVATWEAHHNQKADSPSGTAIEIAKQIMNNMPSKTEIVTDAFYEKPKANQLHVSSTRCGCIPGTHKVFFDGVADTIEITHTARSREIFAVGAVKALDRLTKKINSGLLIKGNMFSMDDLFC